MASKEVNRSKVLCGIRDELIRQRNCNEKRVSRDLDVMNVAIQSHKDSSKVLRDSIERIQVLEYYMKMEGIPIVESVEDSNKE